MVDANHKPAPWYVEALNSAGLTRPDGCWDIQAWEFNGSPLGTGGFGATFHASKPLNFKRPILKSAAIKILNPSRFAGADLTSAFDREVEALANVDSRFVAKLLDAGVENGIPWIATEFIAGQTLDSLLEKSGALGLRDWATLAEHTLRAVHAAHDAQLMHLDIKPANIMHSSKDDSYVIVDYGLARVRKLYDVRDPNLGGTLFYFAPEAFDGENGLSSDIFSLGTTLYQAWTGVNPWIEIVDKFDTPQIPWDVQYQQAQKLGPTWNGVSDGVRSILEPMLSLDPKKRPAPRIILDKVMTIPRQPGLMQHPKNFVVTKDNIFHAWQSLQSKLVELITQRGLKDFKLDVHSDHHNEISFRIKEHHDGWHFTCTVPKNPANLVAMGWKPGVESLFLTRILPQTTTPEKAAEVIQHALESGYGLTLESIRLV